MSLRGIGVLNSDGYNATGEEYFLHHISKYIKNPVIFDVGANTGNYSKDVIRHIPKAKLLCFEPHPKTFKALTSNLSHTNALLFNLGLGAKKSKSMLFDFADDADLKSTQPTSTLASTYPQVISVFHKQKAQSFTIKIDTVDEYIKKYKLQKISILKIDTEGSEYDCMLGAKGAIIDKKIEIIQFEFNEMNVYSKTFFKDISDLLNTYVFYRLLPHGFYKMGEYKPSTHEIFAFQNIIAVRKDKATKYAFN